ncbi:AT-hook motif nuclear-localized protein 23-like [Vicia villosa]|uniref:AT-hook motif nuclear-localized protein 23-like n=1 Tax=Vicia villosa TaxID=3911 RepID=UPI00273CB201|nr:AT-hook motif nuclear-localized protein 23-like [Vicia villosa]
MKMAWHLQADILVLRGSGLVFEVTLLDTASLNSPFTIRGNLQMTSFTGSYFNPNSDRVPSEFVLGSAYSFTIFLFGNHGQVCGGVVRGNVRASSVVLISSALCRKPKFYRVPSNKGDMRVVKKVDPRLDGVVDHNVVVPQHNNKKNIANVSNALALTEPHFY